jgi:hypothetical protein
MSEFLYPESTFSIDNTVHDIIITQPGKEIIRIDQTGRLFWHEREVETDDDFRAAMLDLADCFMGKYKGEQP